VVGFDPGVTLATVGERVSVVGGPVVTAVVEDEEEGRGWRVLGGTETEKIHTLPFKSLGSPRQFRVFHEKSHFYLSNEYKI